jgi:hypothetical protein
MFELHFEQFNIREDLVSWEIATVPWDTETFGFDVSLLKPHYDMKFHSNEANALKDALIKYSQNRHVRLIIVSIPSEQFQTCALLQKAGFRVIDTALGVRYENLHEIIKKDSLRLSLSPAVPDEMNILADMAAISFQHGRYHLDPCLPRILADQRYKDWLKRCHHPENPQKILTARVNHTICGFSVVEYNDSRGYLHLHAIDFKWHGQKLGQEMIIQSLRYLYEAGARHAETKISASNLAALNMHSRLQGRFIAAETLLHWHQTE